MAQKIATMDGVYDILENDALELWDSDGKLVVRVWYDYPSGLVEFPLIELLGWLRLHIKRGNPVGDKVMAMLPELERQYSV